MNVPFRPIQPAWSDGFLLGSELLFRQVYWRSNAVRSLVKRLVGLRQKPPLSIDRGALKDYLKEIGVTDGALVMAHTSASQVQFRQESENVSKGKNFLASAKLLRDDLIELLGPTGTLVMPSHPIYQYEDLFRSPEERANIVIPYDPRRTPCAVGMTNELFWRSGGVLRSLHPYNTLAAKGPLAEELLRGNLNDQKPLPHGIHSGYYRLCQRGGIVVGIGASLRRYMTLIHVAEDVRDAEWPVPNFFEERRYRIRIEDRDEIYVTRQRRPEIGFFSSLRQAFIDLAREGIIHQGCVDGVIVDWASAREVFDYMMEKNRRSHYPYHGLWFSARS